MIEIRDSKVKLSVVKCCGFFEQSLSRYNGQITYVAITNNFQNSQVLLQTYILMANGVRTAHFLHKFLIFIYIIHLVVQMLCLISIHSYRNYQLGGLGCIIIVGLSPPKKGYNKLRVECKIR